LRGSGAAAQPSPTLCAASPLDADLVRAAGATPHAAADPGVITSGLYPHQSQALAWMIGRENGGGLPPFWWAGADVWLGLRGGDMSPVSGSEGAAR
jgi:hypothetical protein